MSTDAAVFEAHGDPELVEAVSTLQSVPDCRADDGTIHCPACGSVVASLPGLSNHCHGLHDKTVAEVILGADQWRFAIETCHGEYGMSTYRIANYLPGHTGRASISSAIERFDLSKPDGIYGKEIERHPEDPFEEIVQDTHAAAMEYLDTPGVSSFLAKFIADEVGVRSTQVGRALMQLQARGKAEALNASSPRRWTLVDEEGEQ